jgi:hypothetical protein
VNAISLDLHAVVLSRGFLTMLLACVRPGKRSLPFPGLFSVFAYGARGSDYLFLLGSSSGLT